MPRKKTISIVIPVYNEEKVIPELLIRLKKFFENHKNYNFETVLVENGSSDQSFRLLKKASMDKRFKVLQLSRNFGCDGGIVAGMRFIKGDACVILMADLQEPIELIADFIKKWEEGYEIVYGLVKKRTAGFLRNSISRLFYKIMSIVTNNAFPENASDFRLLDKKVYQVINTMEERNKYLRGLIIWTGFKHIGIPFSRKKRFAGESKANFKTVFGVALNGIFSFSYLPLRFVTILGLFIIGLSFFLIIFYLSLYLIVQKVAAGFTTVILLILFLFGILFFSLGIISEYLARIYDEVKKRPSFIVKNKINLNHNETR